MGKNLEKVTFGLLWLQFLNYPAPRGFSGCLPSLPPHPPVSYTEYTGLDMDRVALSKGPTSPPSKNPGSPEAYTLFYTRRKEVIKDKVVGLEPQTPFLLFIFRKWYNPFGKQFGIILYK